MPLYDKILWQIETRLNEPLTLDQLAAKSAVSTHHMCRVFREGAGLPIMAYIRARRLSEAAKAIAYDTPDLLTIALDAGYTSHEAFTRAFQNHFGMLPSALKHTQSLTQLTLTEAYTMQTDFNIDLNPPQRKSRAAFRVVGMSLDVSIKDLSGVPALWQSFAAREAEVPTPTPGVGYGVSFNSTEAGTFTYMAGVAGRGDIPTGMTHIDIPAGDYAVFTHAGHISEIHKTIFTIWNRGLTDNNLTPTYAADFEYYDQRFNPETGNGVVDIWIPVAQA
ncbi:MAG: AraC family transcriptional regulator [Pseudomonadota bacterium]